MTFPWLAPRPTGTPRGSWTTAALRELRDRAALFYRLGVPADAATARLIARVAWECPHRPAALDDAAIAALVRDTYARRPAGA